MSENLFSRLSRRDGAAHLPATRYCKLCGLGPREWMECEMPDCAIETQDEADARALKARNPSHAQDL